MKKFEMIDGSEQNFFLGLHIKRNEKAPSNSGSEFYNYKDFHNIVLLAVVDFDYKFLLVDIGRKGRHNDSSIFSHSETAPYLEKQITQYANTKIT